MAQNKDDYAIVIGINDYPLLFPLFGAHRDATAFVEWLISPEGGNLPENNISLILSSDQNGFDPLNAVPVQTHIDRALNDLGVLKKKKIGRRLYFYFSGHGFGSTVREVGLLMANADLERLSQNIGLKFYRDYFLEHVLFDQIFYILDCCRDPMPSDQLIPLARPTFQAPVSGKLGTVQDYVVMAASYGAKAFERTDKATGERSGLLTKALIEGLKGHAVDAKNEVTTNSLRAYLQERVPELAKDVNKEQKPEVEEPTLTPELVFCTISAKALPKMRVRIITKGLNGELVIQHGGNGDEVCRLNASNAKGKPWEVELPANSHYFVEHSLSRKRGLIKPQRTNGEAIEVRVK